MSTITFVKVLTFLLFFCMRHGSSTVESLANAHKPQRCGVFLSNFIYFYVACVACLWYNGFEVMTLETIF